MSAVRTEKPQRSLVHSFLAQRLTCELLTRGVCISTCMCLCVAVAVVVQRVGLNDVTIAVDGSLYRFHPHFKQLMTKKIAQLLPDHMQVSYHHTHTQKDTPYTTQLMTKKIAGISAHRLSYQPSVL